MVIRRLVHLLGAGVVFVTSVLRRINTFDGRANNNEFNWALRSIFNVNCGSKFNFLSIAARFRVTLSKIEHKETRAFQFLKECEKKYLNVVSTFYFNIK